MARLGRALAAGQESQAVVEPGGDAAYAQVRDGFRGKFDGEGKAVEAAADLSDRRAVGGL